MAFIYCIECVPTGKKYIGQTENIEKRRAWHFNRLKDGKHHSRYLQRAWDKYGEKAFRFFVIEHNLPYPLNFGGAYVQ